jgi:1-deoxy-D-xylulose-5-phosphate reductoisomerase
VLEAADAWTADPATVADVLAAQEWARARAREIAREIGQGVAR